MVTSKKRTEEQVTRFADMFSAMGTGPRLRIMRLLLSAHPDGMVVGDIGSELGHPGLHALAPSGKAEERGLGKGSGAKAPISGTRRTRTCCRSFWASSTPSAAPATKRLNHRRLCACAGERKANEWNSKKS